jgi:hypothetical protein
MGATHFLTKTLPKVAAEMALCVLAYNLTRVVAATFAKPYIGGVMPSRPTEMAHSEPMVMVGIACFDGDSPGSTK